MRIRPFFWCWLIFVCIGVIFLAINRQMQEPITPLIFHIAVDQHKLVPDNMSALQLYLTDPEGMPIEAAQVTSQAHMTNMDMVTHTILVKEQGHGIYGIQLLLYMSGPWAITIQARAPGFAMEQTTLSVHVPEK